SNSGESEEITRLLPSLRRVGAKILGVTASERSTLAAHSDVTLLLGHIDEACPLGLAPTATTTAMLALGDAIALTLMKRRGFQINDYAQLHPAGTLGRKVLPVEDVMRIGDAVARVSPEATVSEVILAITNARAGAAVVVDSDEKVLGVFCDGDLRRGLEKGAEVLSTAVSDVMTRNCSTVKKGDLAGKVLDIMREKRIAELPVVDDDGKLVGVADMKGLVASL
ncbi:MAG: KpsF/GutQ family sugar-phosphate isomerase, partial [Planctomycetes bacterium]|nr:KpsF/GutQ family sugar-phosphate isomerase [Planctomycetota bacterium]